MSEGRTTLQRRRLHAHAKRPSKPLRVVEPSKELDYSLFTSTPQMGFHAYSLRSTSDNRKNGNCFSTVYHFVRRLEAMSAAGVMALTRGAAARSYRISKARPQHRRVQRLL